MKPATIGVLGGLVIAGIAALVPPATTLALALTLVLVSSALVLPERGAIAILWGLSIIPLYLTLPDFTFPLPVELVVAIVLMWRIFVAASRSPRFQTRTDLGLVIVVAIGVVGSTAFSADRLRSALNATSLMIWLFHIPLARTIYREPDSSGPTLRVLAIVVVLQALLGFAQLVGGVKFAMGILTSPLAPVFFNNNALLSRLGSQDFNWLMFDRAFPSGLFINSIVYGLCLIVSGLTLVSVPRTWYPRGNSGVFRLCGAIALVAAFASFKVTSWVSLLAGGMVVLVNQVSNRHHRQRTALVPLAMLAMAVALTRELVTQRLVDVFAVSAAARLLIWNAYLGSIVHHGLIGVGLGQAQTIAPSFATYAAGQSFNLLAAPESSWLGLTVEIGVPATLALLLLLTRLTVRATRPRITRAAPGIIAALVGCTFGVYGLTDEHILPLIALLGGMASALEPNRVADSEATPLHA